MNASSIEVGGRRGRLFEGEVPDTLCFVPEECIRRSEHGEEILGAEYIQSGWDVRNMRFSDAPGGNHLFPLPGRPVVDLDNHSVRTFVGRLRRAQGSAQG